MVRDPLEPLNGISGFRYKGSMDIFLNTLLIYVKFGKEVSRVGKSCVIKKYDDV